MRAPINRNSLFSIAMWRESFQFLLIRITFSSAETIALRLWAGRFKSAAVSRDKHLIACSRYIRFSLVRAGLVAYPKDYRWSSDQRRSLGMCDRLPDDVWYTELGTTEIEMP
jgi:hypothetical protein